MPIEIATPENKPIEVKNPDNVPIQVELQDDTVVGIRNVDGTLIDVNINNDSLSVNVENFPDDLAKSEDIDAAVDEVKGAINSIPPCKYTPPS
jgi:hypothetical protein